MGAAATVTTTSNTNAVTDNTGVHWYPYPFLDVNDLGYGRTLLNCLLVTVFYIALAFGARWLDGRLARLTEHATCDST